MKEYLEDDQNRLSHKIHRYLKSGELIETCWVPMNRKVGWRLKYHCILGWIAMKPIYRNAYLHRDVSFTEG